MRRFQFAFQIYFLCAVLLTLSCSLIFSTGHAQQEVGIPPQDSGSTHGHITDTIGYLTPTCPPAFTATVSQDFTVELATQGHAWVLSSQNAISEGRTSTGSKFVNITFTQ